MQAEYEVKPIGTLFGGQSTVVVALGDPGGDGAMEVVDQCGSAADTATCKWGQLPFPILTSSRPPRRPPCCCDVKMGNGSCPHLSGGDA
jgi:hypothetical protein